MAILAVPKLGVGTGVLLSKMKVTNRADSAILTLKLGYADTGVFWGFEQDAIFCSYSTPPRLGAVLGAQGTYL